MPSMSEEAQSETSDEQDMLTVTSTDSDFISSLDSETGYDSEPASSSSPNRSCSPSLSEGYWLEQQEKKRIKGGDSSVNAETTCAVVMKEQEEIRQPEEERQDEPTKVNCRNVPSQDIVSGNELDILDSWKTLGDSVITDQLSQEVSEDDEKELDNDDEKPGELQVDPGKTSEGESNGEYSRVPHITTFTSASSFSEAPREPVDVNNGQQRDDCKNVLQSANNTENSSRLMYAEEMYPEAHFHASDGSQSASFISFSRHNDAATSNSASRSIETSFVTGSNKKVLISEDKMREIQRQLFGSQPSDTYDSQPERSLVAEASKNENDKKHISVGSEGLNAEKVPISAVRSEIYDAFQAVLAAFPGEDLRWLLVQFKWAWMDTWTKAVSRSVLSVMPSLSTAERIEAIVQKVRLRQTYEDSVLKRIAEFDDTPRRHMVLGILEVRRDVVVLYDGFYSVEALVSQELSNFFEANRCSIGTKIHVFGSERVISNPLDILDLRGPLLKLFANSVRVADSGTSLGAKRSVSFRVRLIDILPSGGVVSSVIVRIRRILERKFRVELGGYRNDVEDYEEEIKKVSALIEKSSSSGPSEYSMEDLRVTPFVKLRVADSSGEAVMVWWQPQEIEEGDSYKFIYLRAVPGREWYLMVDRRSYAEKVS